MKIAIISGSHRHDSQSNKVAHYIVNELKTLFPSDATFYFSMEDNPLPFWDQGVWDGGEHWDQKWKPVAAELQSSDAFVIVSPEWHGMVPSGLKNFFQLCSSKELGHKPGLIVTVSAGMGGSYPVAELRMSSYKNNRIVYIPEHVIVRNVEKNFNDGAPVSEEDKYLRSRIRYTLKMLHAYSHALQSVRESGTIDYKAFPNGM